MSLFRLFRRPSRPRKARLAGGRFRPNLESLESRLVPYAVSGNAWPHPELLSISFVPDGTILGSNANGYIKSDLFSSFNAKFGSPAAWQNQILKAAEVWAQQTNINFTVVADNGGAIGSGNYQQGDPNIGDIRIGGYNFGNSTLAQAYLPPPGDNYSIAGDIQINTAQNFNVGKTYDLFTVMAHEIGHALGLYHSRVITAEMYANYSGVKTGLSSDDSTAIQKVYSNGQPRTPDAYGAGYGNHTFASAADLTSLVDPAALTGTANRADITTPGEVDYYAVTVPLLTTGTFTVTMQSQGLSLLAPTLAVYASNQTTILAQGAAAKGGQVTLTVSVTPGQHLYLRAYSTDAVFGTGVYGLALNFGANPTPTVAPPDTTTAAGTALNVVGGQANAQALEGEVGDNQSTNQTSAESPQTVAMDGNGNYVVVWSSYSLLSGWDVYAQRYNASGVAQGLPFRANTYTAGDQMYPSVGMDPSGNFVIAWSSYGQDGSGWGVYAQRYNASGVAQGGEFRVNTYTTSDQMYPTVAMSGVHTFVITWSSNGQDGDGWGVYAQRYNASGVAQGGEFRVNTSTTGDQEYSRIAMDANGDFVITWSNTVYDASGWGVYAQRYNASGVAQGAQMHVNGTTAGDQMYSTVGMDANGNFVIAWQSYGQDGDGWGVYARRFSAAGAALSGEIQVNTTTAGDQADANVGMSPDGSYMITWSSYGQDGNGWGVYARQFDATGQAQGGEFRGGASDEGDQRYSSLAMDLYGHAVIVWNGTRADYTQGVFSQNYLLRDGAGANFMTPDAYSETPDEDPNDYAPDAPAALQPAVPVGLTTADLRGDSPLAGPFDPLRTAGDESAGSGLDDLGHPHSDTPTLDAGAWAEPATLRAKTNLVTEAHDRSALCREAADTLFADAAWACYV